MNVDQFQREALNEALQLVEVDIDIMQFDRQARSCFCRGRFAEA